MYATDRDVLNETARRSVFLRREVADDPIFPEAETTQSARTRPLMVAAILAVTRWWLRQQVAECAAPFAAMCMNKPWSCRGEDPRLKSA